MNRSVYWMLSSLLPQRQKNRAKDPLVLRWLDRGEGGKTTKDNLLLALRDSQNPIPNDLRGVRLHGEDLRGLDLSGVDFSYADLSGCNLEGARLIGAKLQHCNLHSACLKSAELLRADLRYADLSQAILEEAGMAQCKMHDTILFQAILRGASLSEATLTNSDFRAANLHHARLKGCDLQGSQFDRAELFSADLEGASVDKATFVDADLRQSRLRSLRNFESASFIRSDVRDVDFSGAYLVRRQIVDENYLFEFRTASKSNQIIYNLWKLTSDCGRSLSRWSICVLLVTIIFGFIYQNIDINFGDHETWLSPWYFSVVTLTTLGYGDVLPAGQSGQILAMSEALAGYVLLGGLLSVFSNKMARRGE